MSIVFFLSDFPKDSGPIYRETIAGRFPAEPFNTLSNFLFLAIIIYFSLKIYRNYRQHGFLSFVIPVLFIGFIGGTVYHATRSHEIWLLLDWVPILMLCLAASFYFCIKTGNNRWSRLGLSALVVLLMFGTRFVRWPGNLSISIGYIASALGVLFPIVLYLFRTRFRNSIQVVLAVCSFALAISCRYLDLRSDFLPMGTHWLWHSFGALAVFFLMQYIYLDNTALSRTPSAQESTPQ